MSLKAMSYVSEMRSNLSLLRRCKAVPSTVYERCRSDFLSYLEERVLIYPPSMLACGLVPDMTYQERKSVLGLPSGGFSVSPEELAFQEFLETSSRKARRSQWLWRIGSECEEMRDQGWYPFFVTLTVDPSRCPNMERFWKEGAAFRRYIRRVARVSARAAGMPDAIKRGVSCHQFVRHVGVIEHGSSGSHHHMHLLLWLRAIPESWKVCPNRSIRDPRSKVLQECPQLETYWPHSLAGLSPARYFRHEGDPWSRLGFCVPVDRKKRTPLRVSGARAAGVYLAKYMEKGDRAWLHRVKATRDLGKGRLRNLLFQMSLSHLKGLSFRPRSYHLSILLQTIHNVPSVFLRSMAKQILFCRQWDSVSGVPPEWMQENCGIYTQMRDSVRSGTRPQRMSLKEFYDWVTGFLPVPNGYCEKLISSSHLQLMATFPADAARRTSHLGGISNA